MTAQSLVYLLCLVTCVLCGALLTRAYLRTRMRLLLWCALCFVFLAVNNTLVVIDILWPPVNSLVEFRLLASLAAVGVLIYGFLWEVE
jgi:hypothetical protein